MKKTYEDFVTVFFEGLMVSCINPVKGQLETGILRRENHDFSVRVAKYDGDVKVEDNTYKDISNENVEFNIEGVGHPEVAGIRKYQSGSFDRKNNDLNDPRDIRWLVDLENEEFYNSKVEPTGESYTEHNMPINKTFLKNAELFVNQITAYDNEIVLDDENGAEISREFFGKTAVVLGACINSDGVNMSFKGTNIPNLNLNRSDGINVRVFINNLREGGDEQNELPVYHRVLKHQSGKQYNLEKIETVADVQMYTRSQNCTKVFLGKTDSLDEYQ